MEDTILVTLNDKDKEAVKLAQEHYRLEAGITRIFRITGSADVEFQPNEPIKLLEVNENTIPSGVMPLSFGPAPCIGITFPSTIVEVTPDEFIKIERNELKLPDGWKLELDKPLPRAN